MPPSFRGLPFRHYQDRKWITMFQKIVRVFVAAVAVVGALTIAGAPFGAPTMQSHDPQRMSDYNF